jgi:hypothetical protein
MKTKSIIIIAATLIIGFAIGFLVNGQLTRDRIQRFVRQGTADGFKVRFFDIIRPDDAQRAAIEPILDEYAQKMDETVVGFRDEMKSVHQELIKKLEPYLDADQIEHLKIAQERFERHGLERHGHGPGMGPPPDRLHYERR